MLVEVPDIIRDRLAQFSPNELEVLRGKLVDPLFMKLLSVAECSKPSANCAGAGSNARDAFSNDRANARLGEMRGWEMHLAAMFAALNPKPPREEAQENFQPVLKESAENSAE